MVWDGIRCDSRSQQASRMGTGDRLVTTVRWQFLVGDASTSPSVRDRRTGQVRRQCVELRSAPVAPPNQLRWAQQASSTADPTACGSGHHRRDCQPLRLVFYVKRLAELRQTAG